MLDEDTNVKAEFEKVARSRHYIMFIALEPEALGKEVSRTLASNVNSPSKTQKILDFTTFEARKRNFPHLLKFIRKPNVFRGIDGVLDLLQNTTSISYSNSSDSEVDLDTLLKALDA